MTRLITVTDDIATCRELRETVFVTEQGISPEDEWDDRDDGAVHLLARDNGLAVGTARLLIDGTAAAIGRVCVSKSRRGSKLGHDLVVYALDILRARGCETVRADVQMSAMEFYRKLGFTPEGPIFDDAGIPHRKMVRDL